MLISLQYAWKKFVLSKITGRLLDGKVFFGELKVHSLEWINGGLKVVRIGGTFKKKTPDIASGVCSF